MGYGGGNEDNFTPKVKVYVNGNLQKTMNGPELCQKSWYRTGTNRNATQKTQAQKKPVMTTVRKRFPQVRLKQPKYIWDAKTKKYRWVYYTRVYPERLVRQKTKKHNFKQPGLLPNDLNFALMTYVGPVGQADKICCTHPSLSICYEGDLLTNFLISDRPWAGMGSGIEQYMDTSVSSELGVLVPKVTNQAINQFYEKVKNQDVNLLVGLGERRQTAEMFAGLVKRLAQTVLKFKSGNIIGAAKTLFPTSPKAVANDWLLLQYGIKPLLSDIEGASKLIAESAFNNVSFDVKVKKKERLPLTTVVDTTTAYPWLCSNTKVTKMGTVEVTYKARITVEKDSDRLSSITGLSNGKALTWETIPFSFVIDWALPVGDYLNNLDAFTGLKVEWVTKTVAIKETIIVDRTFGGKYNGFYTTVKKLSGKIDKVFVTRQLLTEVPPLPAPEFKDPISGGHIANAVSLLTQALSRKR